MKSTQEHLQKIREYASGLDRSLTFMEVCGTHTMAAFRTGLRSLLPSNVNLVSGPGCPVCVTVDQYIDEAMALAAKPDVIVATFGDMVRVPGTGGSLQQARSQGADVRVVYSPSDALDLARKCPDRDVVFLGVGFETTAPAVAWTVKCAAEENIDNYSVLGAHKRVLPAMQALVQDGEVNLDGFMCPGHVSVIIGSQAYEPLARQQGMPCVVTGFEAFDMAEGLGMLLQQVREGRTEAENQYTRAVTPEGNPAAKSMLDEVFRHDDVAWRGLGTIPDSGLSIRDEYARCDARRRWPDLDLPERREEQGCRCGEVLRGLRSPDACPLFGKACTPSNPVGPCMVSTEGTCAAHYHYGGAQDAVSVQSASASQAERGSAG